MADVFSFLNKKGVYKVAFEIASQSVDYREVKIKNPVAFIFGNEVEGLSQSVLKKCDVVAEIPMKGKKESLNISITVGIGISRLLQ
jgi:tRNA G18 (ribose-2'-O)-methylase SpoU